MQKKNVCIVGVLLISYSCSDKGLEGNLYLNQAFAIKKESNIKEFDGFVEPDIPAENDSLLGIDNNKNGIRDDVEIWINRSEDTYNKRMSLRQLAADLQYLLDSAEKDNVDLISHATSVTYSSSICVTYVFNGRDGYDVVKKLREVVFNSRKRLKALENIEKHNFVYGTIIKDLSTKDDYRSCNFRLKNK